ncbi:hypothetical protein [Hymenobacter sp. 102]|uniref:hypothetical protein n=1 Tax=Hymenobacter sp. 102 TaxID=3403152 RepID=UPI003CF79AA0
MLYAVALCSLLLVLLTALAVRRPDTRRRGLRLGAGLLAAIGLGLTAFPPSSTTTQPVASAAILLTDGYSPDTLRALQRQLGSPAAVWRYATAAAADTPTLSTAAALQQQLPGISHLHLLGRGLPEADLAVLPEVPLHVHADAPGVGFTTATWPRQSELGQPWAVEGTFLAADKGPVWVRLVAAGAPRDSVQLPAGRGSFRLQFTPRLAGVAVYQVQAYQAGRQLAQEAVPVEVLPTQPVRILMLAAAPSFEIRFLKDELAARQHKVALRIGVSRGLTQTEFLNLPTQLPLSRLTPRLLTQFDVLLLDAGTLASLASDESRNLAQAVQNGTCNVLLLADGSTMPRQLPGGSAFRLAPRPANAASLPLSGLRSGAPVAAPASYALLTTPSIRPLFSIAGQSVGAATRRVGLGQVAVTTITETFPWLLQQQPAVYHAYWSQLLTAVRPARSAASLRILSPWPVPNAPVLVQSEGLPTTASLTITGPTAKASLALRQDAIVPEWATAPYWPAASGWHEARVGAVTQPFYVYDATGWAAARQLVWQQAARLRQPSRPAAMAPAEAGTTTTATWPRWLGVALFILGAGLLWLEEKL